MSGYTTESMMKAAHQHYTNAASALKVSVDSTAIAEAQAGLLAVELAKYAAGAGWPPPELG